MFLCIEPQFIIKPFYKLISPIVVNPLTCLLKETKLYFCLTQTEIELLFWILQIWSWGKWSAWNWKILLQGTELESWIYKNVETLLRVFFAADDCSKPMFLALSWRLLLSSCRISVCILSHCSSRCSVSSNHLKPLACFGELVQGVRKALPEEHCKSWDSTIIFPHSVIVSLICSGPVWYEKSFNKRNN